MSGVVPLSVGSLDRFVPVKVAVPYTAADVDELIAALQAMRREAFGNPPPTAAVIEVIERGRATDDTPGGSLIVTNELRINGHPVLTTDGGVKIHGVDVAPKELARITVTLPARRITVAAEGDL